MMMAEFGDGFAQFYFFYVFASLPFAGFKFWPIYYTNLKRHPSTLFLS